MQVVRDFVGYTSVWWAQALYRVLTLLSLGLVWVLGQQYVNARLWTLRKCPLGTAEFVYVQVQTLACALLITIQHCAYVQLLLAVYQWTPDTCAST